MKTDKTQQAKEKVFKAIHNGLNKDENNPMLHGLQAGAEWEGKQDILNDAESLIASKDDLLDIIKTGKQNIEFREDVKVSENLSDWAARFNSVVDDVAHGQKAAVAIDKVCENSIQIGI